MPLLMTRENIKKPSIVHTKKSKAYFKLHRNTFSLLELKLSYPDLPMIRGAKSHQETIP